MTAYRVVAPYVTLKVKDEVGSVVIRGYYAGAVVVVEDEAQAKAQADLGLLEEVKAQAEPKAPKSEAPAGNASREAWADYARTKGATDEDLKDPAEGGMSRDDLRTLYGS